ncbi:MAG TPA: hypothetical protein VLJ61_09285 [Pyrinomonadaceae bacterium]|nr:hypothetical protein [Pyrinomonadaceae bacterium]
MKATLTVCPCCGAKFDGELCDGCAACGARAVGPPLARPEQELPTYGHALAISAAGVLLLLAFAYAFVSALARGETFSLGARALLRAAESAAWSLKWSALPAAFALTLVCRRLYSRMSREHTRFVGHRCARAGLALTAVVAVSLAVLVGVTVPERLRMRELARRAAENAVLYETDLALMRYRQRFGTYPAALEDLRRLEDPDGSIARLLARVEAGEYKPETDIASLSSARSKSRGRRRVSELRGAASAPDLPDAGIVLTNYEVVLPGRDGLLGTDDDLRIRDGVIGDGLPAAAKVKATPAVFVKRSN